MFSWFFVFLYAKKFLKNLTFFSIFSIIKLEGLQEIPPDYLQKKNMLIFIILAIGLWAIANAALSGAAFTTMIALVAGVVVAVIATWGFRNPQKIAELIGKTCLAAWHILPLWGIPTAIAVWKFPAAIAMGGWMAINIIAKIWLWAFMPTTKKLLIRSTMFGLLAIPSWITVDGDGFTVRSILLWNVNRVTFESISDMDGELGRYVSFGIHVFHNKLSSIPEEKLWGFGPIGPEILRVAWLQWKATHPA